MKVGDLVQDKHFNQYGIVTSEPWFAPNRTGKTVNEYVMVVWCSHGGHIKYKVKYLEVVNESRRFSESKDEIL